MVKAGKNDTGKQRYKCNICNTRTVIKKDNISRQNELKMFVNWLIDSTKAEHRINTSRSTFYRKTKWCWGVVPKIKSDGIPSVFIFVDATYLSRNLCLLVARSDKVVLNYRWAKQEDFENYYELLKPLERPGFVICDGHRGIAKACFMLWKNIDIQRCVVHIARGAERKLGKRSPSEVNHIFRKHIKKLSALHTRKKSENWCRKFCSLYETYKDHIEHISYSIDSETGEIIRKYRTHQKLFSVCREINILLSKNRLFLFIEHNIPNNSNCIEGGINSPLKNLLRCHRGLTLEHQMRMFEWYLLSRSVTPISEFISTLNFDDLYPENDN